MDDNGGSVDMTEEEIATARSDAAKVLEDVKAGGDLKTLAEEKKAIVAAYS